MTRLEHATIWTKKRISQFIIHHPVFLSLKNTPCAKGVYKAVSIAFQNNMDKIAIYYASWFYCFVIENTAHRYKICCQNGITILAKAFMNVLMCSLRTKWITAQFWHFCAWSCIQIHTMIKVSVCVSRWIELSHLFCKMNITFHAENVLFLPIAFNANCHFLSCISLLLNKWFKNLVYYMATSNIHHASQFQGHWSYP